MRNPSFVEFGGGESSLVERLAGSNGSDSSSSSSSKQPGGRAAREALTARSGLGPARRVDSSRVGLAAAASETLADGSASDCAEAQHDRGQP